MPPPQAASKERAVTFDIELGIASRQPTNALQCNSFPLAASALYSNSSTKPYSIIGHISFTLLEIVLNAAALLKTGHFYFAKKLQKHEHCNV